MDNKFTSRKFIVWVTATFFLILVFICYFISRDSALTEIMKNFAESWGWISTIYIGGNVAQKFTGVKKE
jgi:hypothetical protein